VQLLSRHLHRQIFKDVSFPPPEPRFVRIAREHLEMHGLDPQKGSVLPDTSFTLPPLQGRNIDEHFHRIGVRAARPVV
jgi:DNA polymerase gamma 1